jgi:hypothetical protein
MRLIKDSRYLLDCLRSRLNGLPMPVSRKAEAWRKRRIAVVSRRGGFLYLPVTKAANTSIKHAIAEYDNGGNLPSDFVIHEYGAMHAIAWDESYDFDGFKFSVVRHPFDRMVSCYRNKVLRSRLHSSLEGFGCFISEMPFLDFLRAVADIPDEEADIHFASQSFFLHGTRGCRVDKIVKMEELSESWSEIVVATGLDEMLPHRNPSKDHPFTPPGDPLLVDIVHKRFRDDFELFGYKA